MTVQDRNAVMVIFDNVSFSHGAVPIFKNLSCEIASGDFVMITGPNGVGKSTLFDLIAGKRKPDSGRIIIGHKDVTNVSEVNRAPDIARLFQNPQLGSVPTMTVRENLALAMLKNKHTTLASGMRNFPTDCLVALQELLGYDLDILLNRPMGRLSGGQRQILALVMAVLLPPKLLLLDEPTSALDPASATSFISGAKKIIANMKITALMITHNLHLAQRLGNRLIVLEKGGIRAEFGTEKRTLNMEKLIPDIDYSVLE